MLHRADAVGRHTLRLRDVAARARHHLAHLRGDGPTPRRRRETRPFARYADEAEAGDVLLYQFATASAIAPWLGARPETLVVNYHNVTPPEYYAPWDNGMARHQLLAQTQLRELAAARRARPGRVGLQRGGVAPGRVRPHRRRAPGRHGARRDGRRARAAAPARAPPAPGARWLSVGRLAPNKAHRAAPSWPCWSPGRTTTPRRTLQVVGRPVVPSYTAALHRFVDELGLHDAVTLHAARSATPRWRPPWPAPTSWSDLAPRGLRRPRASRR